MELKNIITSIAVLTLVIILLVPLTSAETYEELLERAIFNMGFEASVVDDISPYDDDGTETGSIGLMSDNPFVGTQTGEFGTTDAVSLTGTTSQYTGLGNVSCFGWGNTTNTGTDMKIVERGNDATDGHFSLFYSPGTNDLFARMRTGAGSRTDITYTVDLDNIITNQSMGFVIQSIDSTTTLTLYHNGSNVSQGSAAAAFGTSMTSNIVIGANGDAAGAWWKGMLDEVACWNFSFTPTQASLIFAGAVAEEIVVVPAAKKSLVGSFTTIGGRRLILG